MSVLISLSLISDLAGSALWDLIRGLRLWVSGSLIFLSWVRGFHFVGSGLCRTVITDEFCLLSLWVLVLLSSVVRLVDSGC